MHRVAFAPGVSPLAYFFEIPQGGGVYRHFIPPRRRMAFHVVDSPHERDPSAPRWTLVLFTTSGCCAQCRCEHVRACSGSSPCFQVFSVQTQGWNAESRGDSVLRLLGEPPNCLRGCAGLWSQRQCMMVPFSSCYFPLLRYSRGYKVWS